MDCGDTESSESMIRKCQQQVILEFENLSYVISCKKTKSKKKILDSLCGRFNPGKLTAILGPSGAGKTSFLHVLSGMRCSGVSGIIKVNREPFTLRKFKKLSCYITQEFSLLPLLSVRETVAIAADFKFGFSMNSFRKNTLVTETLNLLGLLKVSDVQVKNLSGGEKKRLLICLELLTNPPVMFLDEPTSGLDVSSAIQVIKHLKSLARENRTIVCVIHQPNSVLFEIFDDVYIISEGSIIYGGPRSDMVSTFSQYNLECPKYYNPADFAIQLANKQISAPLETMAHDYQICQKSQEHFFQIDDFKNKGLNHESYEKYRALPNFVQVLVFLKRFYYCILRDKFLTHMRIMGSVMIGIVIGLLYFNIGNDAERVVSNIPCIFLFVFCYFATNNGMTAITFSNEADVVVREYQNNWYSLKAYFLSKFISDLPILTICTTIFFVLTYFLSGQPTDAERIVMFWLISMLLAILATAQGYVFGTILKPELALFAAAMLNILMMLFNGFLIRLNDMPYFCKWITYFSFFRHSFEGYVLVLYGNNRSALDCNEIYCHFQSPRRILKELHMTDSMIIMDIIGLIIWIIIFEAAFYIAICWKLRTLK